MQYSVIQYSQNKDSVGKLLFTKIKFFIFNLSILSKSLVNNRDIFPINMYVQCIV